MTASRRFLLLQGPSNRFFAHLAAALAGWGADVRRIHLCPGDALLWRGGRAQAWRGGAGDWPDWIAGFMVSEGITDLALLGDRRPMHIEAIAAAHAIGVRVHHIELGLLRPGRLTLEPDGPGAHFPRDADGVRRLAARARAHGGAAPPGARGAGFAAYAAMDVAWNMANTLGAWALYPGYRRHQLWAPPVEYLGWLWKLALAGRDRRHAAAQLAAWGLDRAQPGPPVFLLPLQLRTDAQIRARGPDADLRVTVRRVIADFRANAPGGARLLVKEHPMDNALTPWRRIVKRAAGADAARIEVIDGGDLSELFPRIAGLVAVNSGAGIEALTAGRPATALGRAIWDIPGLTHQGPLASFWQAPTPPDPDLARDFLAALDWAIQVPGAFDGPAAPAAADAMADRMLAPPRLSPDA
jgi:capsular polysaccharide export protein